MDVGAGLYVCDVVVKKFTFAISSPDEFLLYSEMLQQTFLIPILRKLGAT